VLGSPRGTRSPDAAALVQRRPRAAGVGDRKIHAVVGPANEFGVARRKVRQCCRGDALAPCVVMFVHAHAEPLKGAAERVDGADEDPVDVVRRRLHVPVVLRLSDLEACSRKVVRGSWFPPAVVTFFQVAPVRRQRNASPAPPRRRTRRRALARRVSTPRRSQALEAGRESATA